MVEMSLRFEHFVIGVLAWDKMVDNAGDLNLLGVDNKVDFGVSSCWTLRQMSGSEIDVRL
jgi:hypothetical protein